MIVVHGSILQAELSKCPNSLCNALQDGDYSFNSIWSQDENKVGHVEIRNVKYYNYFVKCIHGSAHCERCATPNTYFIKNERCAASCRFDTEIADPQGCNGKQKEEASCDELSGAYANAIISTVGSVISGSMPGRETPTGTVEYQDSNECRGKVRFPDDREYKFWYNKKTCEIHWDKPQSTNVWRKNNCRCEKMNGKYCSSVTISINGKSVSGQFLSSQYSGTIDSFDDKECRGEIKFPGDKTYSFWFNANTCVIHWGSQNSETVWKNDNCK